MCYQRILIESFKEEIHDLILKKEAPSQKLVSEIFIFDLNHIDWWINENRIKE